jgi:recombination protein RecT
MDKAESTALATLSSYLDQRSESLLKVLPAGLSVDHVKAIALRAANKNPDLRGCTPQSFYIALHNVVSLGLEPDTPLQHANLIAYGDQCTYQLQYRGLLELCRRSGQIQNIYAYPVRDGDEFSYTLGLSPDIKHVPVSGPDKPMTHVYAVAKLKDGATQFTVMTRAEVDKIRLISKQSTGPAWKNHFEQMACKTAVKRLCKMLPQSATLAAAIEKDNEDEMGFKNVTPRDTRPALERVRDRLKAPPALPAAEPEKRGRGRPPKAEQPIENTLGGDHPDVAQGDDDIQFPPDGREM